MSNHGFEIIRLNPADKVVVVVGTLARGERVECERITAAMDIPDGHKIATAPIGSGEAVIKYGQVIGTAVRAIDIGEHVHTHNLSVHALEHDYAVGADVRPGSKGVPGPLTFEAIQRPDGRVATRNYIGVISTVNCSASVARMIADEFRVGDGF